MKINGTKVKTQIFDTPGRCSQCGAYIFLPGDVIEGIDETLVPMCMDCAIKDAEAGTGKGAWALAQGLRDMKSVGYY